ncbi:MAG TPA: extracellular solute-binding protein [Pseudonocardiaceae bacterium]
MRPSMRSFVRPVTPGSGRPTRRPVRPGLAVLAALGVAALGLVACGDGQQTAEQRAGGKVTITVNALPAATDKVNRDKFLADVAEFEAANPDIDVDAREGKMDPQTFAARLAGGQLEDVFYVYFTDPANLIAKRQVADISPYVDEFPAIKQIRPELRQVFTGPDGKVYGLPWTNYSMGLLYNRALFTRAGLDPDDPPDSWDEVRAAARKIAALGPDVVGYGDYSKSNTGGWHFAAELFSIGGEMAAKDGGTWKAKFNDDKGRQVLRQLHDMRWTDNSMGERQLLEWADLLQLMASGKLGMYIATSDNIPTIVNQYKGDYTLYGLGPMPGGKGTLTGGDGFMFNAKASPEKIRAGLKWLTFKFANPDRIAADKKFDKDNNLPVGLPEPNIWTGDAAAAHEKATEEHTNTPQENYAPFVEGTPGIPLMIEPPNAQQIYAVLDTVMQKVLTDRDADLDRLLADAQRQVDSILASVT